MPVYTGAFDIQVLTSRFEGFPNALLEGMAAGNPMVVTDAGGSPEIVVDGETGFVVPVGDVEAIAGAITRLIEDPALRRRMGEAGRKRVEECFTTDRLVANMTRLYEELLAEKIRP